MPAPHHRRFPLALAFAAMLLAVSLAWADDPGEALREAARVGDMAKVEALLKAGAPVDAPARYGQSPLYFAAEKGHLEVARRLVEKGANVNVRDGFFGASALEIALQGGHTELARHLLAHGAEDAASALAQAIESEDLELARAALATGFVEPLELKAARLRVEGGAAPALRELLTTATAKPRQRPPYKVPAERMPAYPGRYLTDNGKVVTVAQRGEGLGLTLPDQKEEMALTAVAKDRFDSADGNLSMAFAGRAGLIEWARVNHGGEVLFLGVAGPDPAPLKSATDAAQPKTDEVIKAGPARPWPQFRGPRASGNGDGQGAPISWDLASGQGVRFKTPIPGIGLSSPVVWDNRIFLTTAVSSKGDATFRTGLYGDSTSVEDMSEHSFRLYSLDATTGKVLWEREIYRGEPKVRRHLKSSLANSTPATDGEHVVVLFGPIGKLAVYDFTGKQIWQKDIGILDANDPQSGSAEWGHASSPVLYGDLVLVQADRRKDSFLAAYRLATGEEVWKVARHEQSTWATPNVLPAPSGDELIANGTTIRAYDPRTGKELWSLGPSSEVVVATPVVGDGMAFVTAGYPPVRPVYAVRPGQRGDLTLPPGEKSSKAVAWRHERGGTYIPTPLLYRGILYTCNNNGTLTAYRSETGEQLSLIRLSAAGASFAASPVAADGRLYIASETGEMYVLRAGPEPERLAVHAMGEPVMSTPAISGGLLIVRTLGHVYGLTQTSGEKTGAPAP